MMDPVSLGVAAAALLGSKFGEGFAKDAGSSGWRAVTHLRDAIARKFGRGAELPAALANLDEKSDPPARAAAAELITAAAESDPDFAAEVHRLIAAARHDRAIEISVAHAYDNAKQVNIRGDNTGTINL